MSCGFTAGPEHEEFGECSNPCRENDEVSLSKPGTKTAVCRWSPTGLSGCKNREEPCYGNRNWVIGKSGDSNPARCYYNPGSSEQFFGNPAGEGN